jgi:hypothetical protein
VRKKKHKGLAVGPCPEHPGGFRPRPVTFTYNDEPSAPAEPKIIFEDTVGDEERSSSVGYSAKYAAGWDAVFGGKSGGKA